ncbi:Ig-like domain-containing protein [Deinococcus radiophilus]|nr:Ig-like domain-containing protein [Deinococcus radiophilus]UFA51338.1 Ig-like domain-containing protein [Deinococcus radiophilus]
MILQKKLMAAFVTVPLLLASCGGGTPDLGTGNGPGSGSNGAPIVKFVNAPTVTSPNVTVPVRVSDDDKITAVGWVLDAGTANERRGTLSADQIRSTFNLSFSELTAGQHNLVVTATDSMGKRTSATYSFTVDATAPTLSSVMVNGKPVQNGGTVTLATDVPMQVSVTAKDNTGTALIQLFQGNTLLGEGSGTLNAEVIPPSAGTFNYTVRVTDRVGNVTEQAFTVTYSGTSTELPAPQPIIRINNLDDAPYSDILSVTVSAGLAAGAEIDRVILEVTDARGIVDTTTYVANNENPTFSIDTTKYPDGNLTLRAVAVDTAGKRGTSSNLVTTVKNNIAPTLSIVSPSDGGVVRGPTTITVQLKEENTPVTLGTQEVTLEIFDERGQLVTTRQAPLRQSSRGLWQASTTVDFTDAQFVVTDYTIRASLDVTLQGENFTRTVEDTANVTNNIRSTEAPALNILMPAFYGELGVERPVLSRRSAVALQISDSDAIAAALLTFTCDTTVVSDCTSKANSASYQYQIPVGGAGVHQRLLNIGFLMDGQPLLPNGAYVMRLTARDQAGNENTREMPVTVDRGVAEIVGLDPAEPTKGGEDPKSKFTPPSASWTLTGNRINPVRVMTVVYNSNDEELGFLNSSIVKPEQSISYGRTFIAEGEYAAGFLVQDLVTGAVEYFPYNDYAVFVQQQQ